LDFLKIKNILKLIQLYSEKYHNDDKKLMYPSKKCTMGSCNFVAQITVLGPCGQSVLFNKGSRAGVARKSQLHSHILLRLIIQIKPPCSVLFGLFVCLFAGRGPTPWKMDCGIV